MDALHVLADAGVRVINRPRALERTIDKSWAERLLARAGVPTPPTVACERYEAAMEAFDRLGGDVVVKPLFGAMGNGIVRIEDRDVAHRVFRALALEHAVYYVQRTMLPPAARPARARRRRRDRRRDGAGDRLVAGQRRPRRPPASGGARRSASAAYFTFYFNYATSASVVVLLCIHLVFFFV